jgi:RNA polymerase sigma-70 factor (ECF subfamily)
MNNLDLREAGAYSLPRTVLFLRTGDSGSFWKSVMSFSILDDATLLKKLSQGSEEAISVLYDRYGSIVFGIALHMVGDRETAEEITQDVFTNVWNKVGSYRADQSKVATWISRITRNRAIDELRKRRSRPEQHRVRWENGLKEEPSGSNSPEERMEITIERQRVRAALAAIPPQQRQAMELAFFMGYSHSEIARALRQPLGTIKTRIRMGMQKLKQLLTSGEEER